MNKLKEIKSVEELKEFIFLHKDLIKKAALPVTVAAAVLFFWIWGINNEKTIEEKVSTSAETESEYEEETDVSDIETGSDSKTEEAIYADISGCVVNPGVYQVEEGTRLFQLIEKAGGLTENADTESINRAETVSDGQKIIIYEKGLISESYDVNQIQKDSSGKININKADETQLQEIPGVGPVTAERIIQYRKETGRFSSIEDIKNVSGIGEKTFEKIREHITVR